MPGCGPPDELPRRAVLLALALGGVMTGFNNPLVGGGGALVFPSIHSPNFVTGSTGWSINKDGTAEFNSLTIRNGTVISGVFLQYSSAIPAKGNLVMAFAPIAGGTDAVGNVYPQGFNFGVWNASGALVQHFGVDQNGKLYLADTTGTTRIFFDPSLAAQLFYDSSGIAAGHLIASIASANGVDSAGNHFIGGGYAFYSSSIALLFSGSAGIGAFSGSLAAGWTAAAASIVPTFAGSTFAVSGPLELVEGNAPTPAAGGPQIFGSNVSGMLKFVSDSNKGDGNTYLTGKILQSTTGTQQFTLNTPVAITGLSLALGVGTYHVRLKIFWVPSGTVGSTHVHAFAFTGTATANLNGQCWQALTANGIQQGSRNAGGLASTLTSPTHVAFPGWTEIDMDITVSVAGTLTTTVLLTTPGDDITTSAGTYWEITPTS